MARMVSVFFHVSERVPPASRSRSPPEPAPQTKQPVRKGDKVTTLGKNFEIVKMDDTPLDEESRAVMRRLCSAMADALNKYYAFGSVFAEDI